MLFPFQRFCLFVYKTILWLIPSGVYWAPGTISSVSLFTEGLSIHGFRNQLSKALGKGLQMLTAPQGPETALPGGQCTRGTPATPPGWSGSPTLILPHSMALATGPGDGTVAGSWLDIGEAHGLTAHDGQALGARAGGEGMVLTPRLNAQNQTLKMLLVIRRSSLLGRGSNMRY